MSVAIDTRSVGNKTAAGTSISWTHTVSAGLSNGMLIVLVTTGHGTPVTPSSVVWDSGGANVNLSNTINGVAATKSDAANNLQTSIWFLANPSAGTKTIQVNVGTSCEITGGSASYQNVDPTTPFNAASPQSWQVAAQVNISQSVTSAAGEMVVDCEAVNESSTVTPVAGGSQTQIHNQNVGSANHVGCSSDQAGAATVTVAWTGLNVAGNQDSCGIAASMRAAPTTVGIPIWPYTA